MKAYGQAPRNTARNLGNTLESREQIRLGVRALVKF